MDKAKALHGFWSSFGIPAYDESTVPTGKDAPLFPYLTYNVVVDDFDNPVTMSASLWYRDSSWEGITRKAELIAISIGLGGKLVPYNSGSIWIKRGSPFAQRMVDPSDNMVRRIYINIEAEYLSAF